jgi:YD repeat-containing protein
MGTQLWNVRLFACGLAAACTVCVAQEVIPDFYKGPGLQPNRSYVNQSFNEHIDPFNGSLGLHYTDVRIPGNGGFDITVSRSYNSNSVSETSPVSYFGSAGVGWTVHFGRVLYKPINGPCGGMSFVDVLKDPVLELPDGSTQILARSAIAGATLLSTQRWRAECINGIVVVYSPEGVRYDMGQGVSVPSGSASALAAYYTTKITDRNNNTATITYTQAGSPEVSSVTTSDGRRIDFSYLPLSGSEITRRINTVSSAGQTYTYGYQAIGGAFGAYQLATVTRPDGTAWRYSYLGNLNATVPGGFLLSQVTLPQGGVITYRYGSSSSDYVYFDNVSNPLSRTTVVKSKSTSDGGNWSFSYAPGASGRYDTTTVGTPSGTIVYSHVGPNYASSESLWMVGLLMQKQIGGSQAESYTWTPLVVSPQQFKRPGAWQSTRLDSNTRAALLSGRTITRDGWSYSTTFSNFDAYGNPRTVSESGASGGARTTSFSYYQNTTSWVLREPANELVSGGMQLTRGFDAAGNVTSTTRDGVTTTFWRCTDGSVSQAAYPRALYHVYPCGSYKRGIPQTEQQPEGITISRVVSDAGNVTSEINGRGYSTGFGYDGLNRLTSMTPPQGNGTAISYGATSKSASRGSLTEVTQYDGFGRPISITLAGISRTYHRDPLGRITFVSDPGSGAGTSYQYDILDRVSLVQNADGTTRNVSFGAGSKTVRDERGYSTTYNYRAYGDPNAQLLMSISAPDSAANVSLGRNTRDLVTFLQQSGVTRTYGYDGRGYLVSVTNPETGTTTYGRDDANNMTSRQVGSSGTTTYLYDGQNRLYSVTYPGGTASVAKSYTRTHRLSSVSTSVATRTYNYDPNDNLTDESLNIDALSFTLYYGYNTNDQLSTLTYPRSSRVVNYAPDLLGRPTQVSNFASSVSYWPSGQISQINYANTTVSSYGQNSRLWPSYFTTSKGGVAYVNGSYGYDGLGNLTSLTDPVDSSYSRSLGYDAINRLNSVSGPWGAGTIAYDGAGNIQSQSLGAFNISYSYGADNKLYGVSGSRTETYSYNDGYGDVTSIGNRTLQYDGVPNLTCANCSDAATRVDYQYDGLNQRVSTTKAGVKTYEYYSFNGNLIEELTPSISNRLAEHIYLGSRRIATVGPAPSTITLPAQTLSALAGQPVTVIASVIGAPPTGTVTFFDGQTALATVNVAGGQASVTLTFQSLGAHALTATYSGNATTFSSTATATVNVLSSTTISGPGGGQGLTAVSGTASSIAATINGIAPTGTVSFYDGATLLGTAPLIGGTASISTTFNTTGVHVINMVYSGDSRNAPSSATVNLTVLLPPAQLIPLLELLLD